MAKKQCNSKAVLKELSGLLEECKIDEWLIDTKYNKLTIYCREDFNNFYPRLNTKPMVIDQRGYGVPYGAGHYASFHYKGWEILGHILITRE